VLEGPHEQEAVVHDMPRSGERAFNQQHREGRNQPRRQDLLKHGDPELLPRELDGRVQGVVLIFRNLAAQTGRVQFAGHSRPATARPPAWKVVASGVATRSCGASLPPAPGG
jgi:hypothetical protein